MKAQSLARVGLLVLAIVFVSALAITNSGVARGSSTQSGDDQSVKQALREHGLREVARLKGNYVAIADANWWAQFDLDSLTKRSMIVLVATPLENACHLSADGQTITTDYQVVVQDAVKGNLAQGSLINVSLPGGRVQFDDGTSAEVRTPGFRKMENGKTYVLFLSERNDGSGGFNLVGGPQGLFEVPADGSGIKPHGRSTDEIVKKYKNKEVNSFIKELRKAARKHPETLPCCS